MMKDDEGIYMKSSSNGIICIVNVFYSDVYRILYTCMDASGCRTTFVVNMILHDFCWTRTSHSFSNLELEGNAAVLSLIFGHCV